MGMFSILPASLSSLETWLVRMFVSKRRPSIQTITETLQLFLAIITVGPWILLLVYDALLYIYRSATYELPVIGGRARGRQRPRAPSLAERPSGHRRRFSFAGMPPRQAESDTMTTAAAMKRRSNPVVPRTTYEQDGE